MHNFKFFLHSLDFHTRSNLWRSHFLFNISNATVYGIKWNHSRYHSKIQQDRFGSQNCTYVKEKGKQNHERKGNELWEEESAELSANFGSFSRIYHQTILLHSIKYFTNSLSSFWHGFGCCCCLVQCHSPLLSVNAKKSIMKRIPFLLVIFVSIAPVL